MENGKLKVNSKGKVELKVNGKEQTNIKEFDFSSLGLNSTHDCQVEMTNGKPVRIVINGKDVPKNEQKVQQREEERKNREAEEVKRKEQELLKRKEEQRNQNSSQRNNDTQMSVDSYKLALAQVPSDTREKGDPSVIENFALKFYKFARFEENQDSSKSKFHFFKTERGRIDYALKPDFSKINFTALANREKQNAQVLVKHLEEPKIFKPNWRLVIGLGGDSVCETGMTLHHIYGFPYIPASAIKGVLRSYIIQTIFLPEFEGQDNAGEEAEKKALKDLQFEKIFGSTDQQGKAIFFDAFPTEIPKLKPDIMNVHYKEWYGNDKDRFNNPIPPTDTQQPNPILFLTVEDTPFQFLIGSKESDALTIQGKILMSWLTSALEEHGIGAKTAVGYGYMQ